jgi:nitronate monooxygenase
MFYALNSLRQLKKSNLDQSGRLDYWQAGKSVNGIHDILPVAKIMEEFKCQLNN